MTDPEPAFAQRMANELASTYKRLHAEQQGKRTVDAIKYIDDQLKGVRLKLRNAEEEFNSFSQTNQLISIDLQSENLLLRQKELNEEIRKQNDDKNELGTLLGRVENFLGEPSSSDTNFYSTIATCMDIRFNLFHTFLFSWCIRAFKIYWRRDDVWQLWTFKIFCIYEGQDGI